LTGFRLLILVAALGPWASARAGPPATPPAETPAAAAGLDASGAEARAAYKRGADLYRAGRYREAIGEFQAADRMKPSPALHYNIGQAWEKLGDVPAALAAYARYLRLDPRAPNREAVERSVRSLEGKLAASGLQMLHVTTVPPDADLSVDGGASVRAPLDAAFAPGRHAVGAAAPGHRTATREVQLPGDRSLEVSIVLEPGQDPAPLAAKPPPAPLEATRPDPAPQPVERKSWLGPIVAGGLAVVAAGAGVVMGVQARNAQNALLAGGNDRQQADALASKAKSDATTANVLYGVAGAAALTGGILAIAF
jgi:tetratricopeptide (TPR) repeat protein